MAETLPIPRTDTVATAMSSLSGPSPGTTVCDYDALTRMADKLPETRPQSQVQSHANLSVENKSTSSIHSEPLATTIPQAKKWGLLAVFSLGFFVDIWSYSAFFIFTDPISEDLGVPFAQQSWIIVSFSAESRQRSPTDP